MKPRNRDQVLFPLNEPASLILEIQIRDILKVRDKVRDRSLFILNMINISVSPPPPADHVNSKWPPFFIQYLRDDTPPHTPHISSYMLRKTVYIKMRVTILC